MSSMEKEIFRVLRKTFGFCYVSFILIDIYPVLIDKIKGNIRTSNVNLFNKFVDDKKIEVKEIEIVEEKNNV